MFVYLTRFFPQRPQRHTKCMVSDLYVYLHTIHLYHQTHRLHNHLVGGIHPPIPSNMVSTSSLAALG
jgi:hypothetical protein